MLVPQIREGAREEGLAREDKQSCWEDAGIPRDQGKEEERRTPARGWVGMGWGWGRVSLSI